MSGGRVLPRDLGHAPAIRSRMTWSGTLSDATKLRWSSVLPSSWSRSVACDALRGKPSRIQFCSRMVGSGGAGEEKEGGEGRTHAIPQGIDRRLHHLEDQLVRQQSCERTPFLSVLGDAHENHKGPPLTHLRPS